MGRREFIALVGSTATAWSLSAHAQQQPSGVKRIAVLMNLAERDSESKPRVAALKAVLRKWVGRKTVIY